MKTLKIKNVLIACFTLLLVTACTEEIVRDPSPVVSAGNETVYFSSTNVKSYELDPADAKSVTVVVEREDSVAAAEVPLNVLENDSNIFVIPQNVVFAAGASKASLVVTFPDAKEGIPYSFEVAISGDKYLNPYSNTVPTIKVTTNVIKWNLLGQGQFYDSFTLYSVADIAVYYSPLKNAYRFANPYSNELLVEAEWGTWIGGPTSNYIVLYPTSDGHITWDFWYVGLTYKGLGNPVKAYFPAYLDATQGTTYAAADEVSIIDPENDKLFNLYPHFFMDGLGGYGTYVCYVSLPGGPDLNTILAQ